MYIFFISFSLINCIFGADRDAAAALIAFGLIDHSFAVRTEFDGIHRTDLDASAAFVAGSIIDVVLRAINFSTTYIYQDPYQQ